MVGASWPIKHSMPQQTAAIEAYEEAGVRGAVGEEHVGRFRKRRLKRTQSVIRDIEIFLLR
jgi:8-oxo-dGTP pyrophosphatase MutT (NUDIX family)